MKTRSTSGLLELLDAISRALTPQSARAVLRYRPSARLQRRIARLAEKCNEGQLSDEEHREYESYVVIMDIVAILQLRARDLLEKRRGA